jgi:hypothetical protein
MMKYASFHGMFNSVSKCRMEFSYKNIASDSLFLLYVFSFLLYYLKRLNFLRFLPMVSSTIFLDRFTLPPNHIIHTTAPIYRFTHLIFSFVSTPSAPPLSPSNIARLSPSPVSSHAILRRHPVPAASAANSRRPDAAGLRVPPYTPYLSL